MNSYIKFINIELEEVTTPIKDIELIKSNCAGVCVYKVFTPSSSHEVNKETYVKILDQLIKESGIYESKS